MKSIINKVDKSCNMDFITLKLDFTLSQKYIISNKFALQSYALNVIKCRHQYENTLLIKYISIK